MNDFSRQRTPGVATGAIFARGTTVSTTLLQQVLGLLGVSFLCTGGGAILGISWGPQAFMPAIIAGFVALLLLRVVASRTPLNMGLLYFFATCEGVVLGLILQSYAADGYGGIIIDAALTTAALTFGAGGYGLLTRRDLSGLGDILMVCLFGLIVSLLLGLVLNLGPSGTVTGALGALIFTGFIAYDFNRVARRRVVREGDAVLLTVAIYLDILNLFLSLLRLLRAFR
jgi:FtsH-binding integral membrane protein